jgi:hypothetical protein
MGARAENSLERRAGKLELSDHSRAKNLWETTRANSVTEELEGQAIKQ